MPLPPALSVNLRLPVVVSPMFLVSGPALVSASRAAGVIGTFPALNQRTTEGFDEWLQQIEAASTPTSAAYGVNLIVHKTNPRVEADLEVCVKHKVPLIITSLGAVKRVVDQVHAYGGVVFHDVTNMRHAAKAIEAGVDGLILVSNGAGGHAGTMNPFAFIEEIKKIFNGTILMAGSLSTGRQVAAARMMGADLAYMGTRFIATQESAADQRYKDMLSDSTMADIVYTPAISGIPANFLRQSLIQAGLDPENLPDAPEINMNKELNSEAKVWKDIWSAGQGVGAITDSPPVAALVDRLEEEYRAAATAFQST